MCFVVMEINNYWKDKQEDRNLKNILEDIRTKSLPSVEEYTLDVCMDQTMYDGAHISEART